MQHISQVTQGSSVNMPAWQGERHYMVPFSLKTGLPKTMRRYQQVVDQMMEGVIVAASQECYVMVDESVVLPVSYHRRPGLHIDGYWNPGVGHHGGISAHGHGPGPGPRWNAIPVTVQAGHRGHKGVTPLRAAEGLLLASNFTACRAFVGQYERDFKKDWRGGDCSDLDVSVLDEVFLEAGRAYHMDVMTLHESLPVPVKVQRSVIRINVPNWLN